MNRLRRSGQWRDQTGFGIVDMKFVSHSQLCSGLARPIPEMKLHTDHSTKLLPIRRFTVDIKSRNEWEKSGSPRASQAISCYTDGSKLDGKAGAAFHIPLHTGDKMEGCFPLGEHSDVYQAEIVAVIRAATLLRQTSPLGDRVNFYVDSLSTIMSMTSHWPQPGLVGECHGALNELAEIMEVTLNWIPAHCWYSGNERADVLAKKATQMSFTGPEPIIPISTQVPDHAIDVRSRKEHITKWHTLESCETGIMIL